MQLGIAPMANLLCSVQTFSSQGRALWFGTGLLGALALSR